MLITHEVIRRVRRISGLEMVCGRDALAGMHAHNVEDLMNRVPGGDIAPMEALVSANSFAAEAIKMADQIGLLAPELEADIIALDDDRVTDIAAVCRVVFVVQGGVVYKKKIGPAYIFQSHQMSIARIIYT